MEASTVRPRLFLDIDGVLYAHYGGTWQLRPYIRTLTDWAKDHFDIYFVSYNSRAKQVVASAYAQGEVIEYWRPFTLDKRGFKVDLPQTWHPKADWSEKLIAIQHNGGLNDPWFLIEDTPPSDDQMQILKDMADPSCWLVVPDTGADVLLDVKIALEGWLKTGKLTVPFDWATRIQEERDLCTVAEWKGYGLSGRKSD